MWDCDAKSLQPESGVIQTSSGNGMLFNSFNMIEMLFGCLKQMHLVSFNTSRIFKLNVAERAVLHHKLWSLKFQPSVCDQLNSQTEEIWPRPNQSAELYQSSVTKDTEAHLCSNCPIFGNTSFIADCNTMGRCHLLLPKFRLVQRCSTLHFALKHGNAKKQNLGKPFDVESGLLGLINMLKTAWMRAKSKTNQPSHRETCPMPLLATPAPSKLRHFQAWFHRLPRNLSHQLVESHVVGNR